MKRNEKNSVTHDGSSQLFGVDFHDFIQREQTNNMVELASDFGISVNDVKQLKRRIERS